MRDGKRAKLAAARQQLTLMRAMARRNAMLAWSGEGESKRLRITSTDNEGRAKLEASAKAVSALASMGLIAEHAGIVVVTAAGFAWLRRQLASGDAFQEQHQDTKRRLATGPHGTVSLLRVNDAESPLAWLRRRKDGNGKPMLDDAQFDAGERLRRDYTFAAMTPRITADWSGTGSPGGRRGGGSSAAAMRDDVVAAKERVHRAIAAVGPELGRILFDVCCLLKGIERAESEQGLPQRSGKVVLQLALTSLARHYGVLAEPAQDHQTGAGRTLHWGMSDFRPAL